MYLSIYTIRNDNTDGDVCDVNNKMSARLHIFRG